MSQVISLGSARSLAAASEPCYVCAMRDHSFAAIDELIRQVEKTAAARPDQVRLISELIRLSGDRGVDPYLLIGALVEAPCVREVAA